MPIHREDLLRTLIPPAAAVILSLLFFAIFDRWTQIDDPINSIVAMIMGLLGFAIGALIDIRRARSGKRPAAEAIDTTS